MAEMKQQGAGTLASPTYFVGRTASGKLPNGDEVTCGDISTGAEYDALRIGNNINGIFFREKVKRSIKSKNGAAFGAGSPDFDLWWESIGVGGRQLVGDIYTRAVFTEQELADFQASLKVQEA